MLNLTLLLLE